VVGDAEAEANRGVVSRGTTTAPNFRTHGVLGIGVGPDQGRIRTLRPGHCGFFRCHPLAAYSGRGKITCAQRLLRVSSDIPIASDAVRGVVQGAQQITPAFAAVFGNFSISLGKIVGFGSIA
jgi:hypothetical protein